MNLRLAAVRLRSLRRKDRLGSYLSDYVNRKMARKFGFSNGSEVPAVSKISLSTGIGKIRDRKATVSDLKLNLTKIAGQPPTMTRARKAIANFQVRRHEIVGLRMAVRKRRMLEFLDRLVNLAAPRMKDFRGIPTGSFDRKGNLSLGLTSCSAFPESGPVNSEVEVGMNVSITLTTENKWSGPYLLRSLNFPLRR